MNRRSFFGLGAGAAAAAAFGDKLKDLNKQPDLAVDGPIVTTRINATSINADKLICSSINVAYISAGTITANRLVTSNV